jgi:hypothetical protein
MEAKNLYFKVKENSVLYDTSMCVSIHSFNGAALTSWVYTSSSFSSRMIISYGDDIDGLFVTSS